MSSIGSGPGIGSGPNVEVNAVRGLSATDKGAGAASTIANDVSSVPVSSGDQASVVASTTLGAGNVPVDAERVATIKKAIENGNYPVIPTKISDAMIAAGMLLRVAK
jgi:negative regulator of flagellin synthesis FlgM